jgi:hypothetical protein
MVRKLYGRPYWGVNGNGRRSSRNLIPLDTRGILDIHYGFNFNTDSRIGWWKIANFYRARLSCTAYRAAGLANSARLDGQTSEFKGIGIWTGFRQ